MGLYVAESQVKTSKRIWLKRPRLLNPPSTEPLLEQITYLKTHTHVHSHERGMARFMHTTFWGRREETGLLTWFQSAGKWADNFIFLSFSRGKRLWWPFKDDFQCFCKPRGSKSWTPRAKKTASEWRRPWAMTCNAVSLTACLWKSLSRISQLPLCT